VVEVSEIFSRRGARKVARVIGNLGPKKVLLSGYPLGYELLAEELRQNFPEIRVFAYIHSSFTWLGIDIYQAENPVLERIINLSKEGVIEKVGFCKRDLAEYFKEQGVNSFFVMNRFEIPKKAFKPLSQEKIKIGVFGHSWWHRNILNQVIAALMIPNSEIHVNEIGDFDFVDEKRVVVHGFLPKAEFNKVMAEMDLNLYVSFTDCFPMTLIESMELGIPAIASDTSDVYSFDKKIKDRLVVSTIDGPLGIKEKIEEVIKDYDQIQKMITDYLPLLKEKVEKSISDFLK
jgi:glycosyltransferase involved in cell wall biosynthesis